MRVLNPANSLIAAGNGLWDADERGITPIERKFSTRVRRFCHGALVPPVRQNLCQRFSASEEAYFSIIQE